MYSYAQTNIQLYNQLQEKGYSCGDLQFVRMAYDFAIQIFSGRFQDNGKDFLSHCVGTASILAAEGQPVVMVVAGLIHNVYRSGDFGDGERGITRKRQQLICQTLGSEVEELVFRFHNFRFGQKFLPMILSSLETMSPLDRGAVLLRLADNLEHNLFNGSCYYSSKKRSTCQFPNWNLMTEVAKHLSCPMLAQDLERVQRENAEVQMPQGFLSVYKSGFIIPHSLKKRGMVFAYENWQSCKQWSGDWASFLMRLLRSFYRKSKRILGFVQ